MEFNGGHAFELTRLNRALAHLARPGSREDWLSSQRKQSIERLWSRKRRLLREVAKYDGYGPEFPVA